MSIPLPSQATYHKLKIDHLAAAIAGVVWIIDSGATIHVSGDRNLFKNLRHSHAKVETADGSILPIKCMGDCMIQLPGGSDLTLTQVLFVPGIKVNLISVAAFGDKGIGCYFPAGRPAYLYKGQHVAFTDNVKQQYLLRTETSKAMGLREVKGPAQIQWEEDSHHTFKMAKETTNIEIWHRRFAHLGYRNVLSNVKKVIGMEVKGPIPEEACEPCLKVKQYSETSRRPMSKATAFLDRIHVDIGGPLPATFRSNRYFLLIKDDAFGMFFVYIMRTKDEIHPHLKEFRAWIEKQTSHQIKHMRAGDELGSSAFAS